MKVESVERLPLFRSPEQVRIIVELFLRADCPLSLTELARRAGVSIGAVHKEVERLESSGLVHSNRVGHTRLVEVDDRSPLTKDLRSLVTKAFGVVELLRERLLPIGDIERAFIYGSWARSEAGALGRPPQDIDVMVVGTPDMEVVFTAAGEVEDLIGRPVNVTVLTNDEWKQNDTGFLRSLRDGPLVELV